MINFYDLVPSIYVNTSRDFQYLSWLINIVLNSVKHNVDAMYDLPNAKADPRLTEILALTLGFRVKRNYDQKQLTALVSIIPSILRCKGTERAVTLAGEALITASGTTGVCECKTVDNRLEVIIPRELVDVMLFMDLLPYILPAGMTCRIIRRNQIPHSAGTEVDYEDSRIAHLQPDLEWDASTATNKKAAGLSVMLDTTDIVAKDTDGNAYEEGIEPVFANYRKTEANPGYTLNTGLIDNTIIPVLDTESKKIKT